MKERENWTIKLTSKTEKQVRKLPAKLIDIFLTLMLDLERKGFALPDWPHYSPLGKSGKDIHKDSYHCNLKRGNPSYVVVWRIIDKKKKEIEVYYVGTHKKAPY